jgi:hypothetical protein
MVRNKNYDTPHYSGNYVKNFPLYAVYLVQIYTAFREFVFTCVIEINFKLLFSYYLFRMPNEFILGLLNDAFNR